MNYARTQVKQSKQINPSLMVGGVVTHLYMHLKSKKKDSYTIRSVTTQMSTPS